MWPEASADKLVLLKTAEQLIYDATQVGARLAMISHCKDNAEKITIQQYSTAHINDGQKVITPFEHFASWQKQP